MNHLYVMIYVNKDYYYYYYYPIFVLCDLLTNFFLLFFK